MSYSGNNPFEAPGSMYSDRFSIAADAPADLRGEFISKTYFHLSGAVIAFVGLEAVFVSSGIAETLLRMLATYGQGWGWLLVLGAFVLVATVARNMSLSGSRQTQYAGLGLYVIAESLIFAPIIYLANSMGATESVPYGILPTAGVVTIAIFAALSMVVFVTKKDFSFLAPALTIATFGVFGLIIASAIFGFSLGILFTVGMIVLASGYILYDTSRVLHHYRTDQYVGAATALFASVALLFWYVLQLFMSRD
ncbi:Inhibitor of apoptosis-promoting Bax1 [Planctomycetes bacterium Pan216]|uniref:Inhibitor of apoptosis-promoting Bax1 n=1 Tax=Kolteria novifilia TaxID=2527975 RepID=A0A518B645_9BACT|nr:Inhibitor of apoptosis-promoting Bax1 [Planctomycetes bacterium Pan216]